MLRSVRDVVERLDVTQHHLSNHLVKHTPRGLVATCYVLAQHVRTVNGDSQTFTFGGRYTDHLRGSDHMQIAHRRLELLWSSGEPSILSP